jgi:hypothetical protein
MQKFVAKWCGKDMEKSDGYRALHKVFEGEKAYKFPQYPNRVGSKVNHYTLASGTEFWFEPKSFRVLSSDRQLYLQSVIQADFGDLKLRILLCIDDRKLMISRAQGASLETTQPRTPDGRIIWNIEEIGSPFYFFTGHCDRRNNIHRPNEERYQIISNASGFKTQSQQTRGLSFLGGVLEKYGNFFSDGLSGGLELPGVMMLSKDLENRIATGDLITG